MEKEQNMSFEALKAQEEELRKKITDLDAAGDKGEEWNRLNLEHDQVQEQIAAQDGKPEQEDEMQEAA